MNSELDRIIVIERTFKTLPIEFKFRPDGDLSALDEEIFLFLSREISCQPMEDWED